MVKTSNDLCIVGAGTVGLILAKALSYLPLRLVLVDAKPTPQTQSNRSFVLSMASVRVLKTLGVWIQLEDQAHPITQVTIRAPQRPSVHLRHPEAVLGYVIQERALNQVLWAQLPNITCHLGVVPQQRTAQQLVLKRAEDASDLIVESYWTLGCDGANSWCRSQAAMGWVGASSPTACLMMTVRGPQRVDRAIQSLHQAVISALIPLDANGRFKLIVTGSSRAIQAWAMLPESTLLTNLAQTLDQPEWQGFELESAPKVYTLNPGHARQLVGDRITLLGAAALHVSPVAAQGLNRAIEDIGWIFDLYLQALQRPEDQSLASRWHSYGQWRQAEHRALLQRLNWISTMQPGVVPLEPFKRLAFGLAAHLTGVQRRLCDWGMGLAGPQSPLCAQTSMVQLCQGLSICR